MVAISESCNSFSLYNSLNKLNIRAIVVTFLHGLSQSLLLFTLFLPIFAISRVVVSILQIQQ